MITEDKVTEIFCMADYFCYFFDSMMAKYTLKPVNKKKYHRDSTMSKAEIMLIMILFHDSGYRCLKHFYLEKVCKHLCHLFPEVVSYTRFVELEREVAIPLDLFIKRFFWVSVLASVLWTAHLFASVGTSKYTFTRYSRVLPKKENAPWDAFSASNYI